MYDSFISLIHGYITNPPYDHSQELAIFGLFSSTGKSAAPMLGSPPPAGSTHMKKPVGIASRF